MNRHALSENVFDFVSSATCSRLLDYAGLMHAGFVVPSQPFEFALRQNILDTLGWLSGLNQKLVKRRSPSSRATASLKRCQRGRSENASFESQQSSRALSAVSSVL